ncbi:hypothetical protein HYDPIDRAFT_170464 [Hydnomerulius pinastri MD-312]|uniref:Cytochrome P450 n=1 Tax=Hydnomerulius pinastri MD-312 TaxID=994086 RepID=A0A0C9W267_9AGAM|nr:hypothetical protein HYDPIDRAFT_170464 [Hydnomerulius pinastri MD-312]
MFSAVLSTIHPLGTLVSFCTSWVAFLLRERTFPPHIPSALPYIGSALSYLLAPTAFLASCQQRYGATYTFLMGGRNFVVVSSTGAISSVFNANSRTLCNDLMHHQMLEVVAGVKKNQEWLHQIMMKLFPLVDKSLSRRSLGQITEPFGRELFSQIEKYRRVYSVKAIPLIHFIQQPLYDATNLAIFGSAFPLDTFTDLHMLDKSVPSRFGRLPFWSRPSSRARQRLLSHIEEYLQPDKIIMIGGEYSQFALRFMEIFEANDVCTPDAARLVLTFMWGLHSNTMSTSFWLFVHLLADPEALKRVRAEVDNAFDAEGYTLDSLLDADPDELDSHHFVLLTSAIMETMRLTALHAAARIANHDFDLKDGEGSIPIKEGQYILGNVHAAHMDESNYPNAHNFVVDRFADQPHQKGKLQTEGHPFYSLGGGRHPCKGRWLAIYQTKLQAIILLRLWDITPANGASEWSIPKVHGRSIGVIHTRDEVLVQLNPRQLGNQL